MLLMSLTSAWAEEVEEIDITEGIGGVVSQGSFTVSGYDPYGEGMWINDGKKITISSTDGSIITKVVFYLSGEDEYEYVNRMIVSSGTVNVDDMDEMTIDNVNATSLEIYSDVVGNTFKICYVDIYYEPGNSVNKKKFVMDGYVQTAFFDTTNGFNHTGCNVSISGTGQNFTINSSDGVEIGKVDLTFSSNVNETNINTGNVGDVEGNGTDWSINNICSSSLTISAFGAIENIKVYYAEVYKDGVIKNETFNIAGKETYSGDKITITGTESDSFGMQIDKNGPEANDNSVTITSNGGVISKVDLHFSYYGYEDYEKFESTVGEVTGSGKNWSINNVNSSSLTISHPGNSLNKSAWIDKITVYYKDKISPTMEIAASRTAPGEYWATFYSNVGNYQAPEGTKVYIVTLNGTSITMAEIADRIINKEQGVVLMSETGDVVMSKTNNYSSGDYSDNDLLGTPVKITNPGNAYVLNNKMSNGVGFYKLSSTGYISANKAYLVYNNAANGTAQAFFAFDSAVTGVEVNKADANEDEHKVYDLQGRRVAKPANGLYIVNGKKVIMK